MTPDDILARLVELGRLIEAHKTAVFVAEQERLKLRNELRASGWKPHEVTVSYP